MGLLKGNGAPGLALDAVLREARVQSTFYIRKDGE